jgi:hypothetical protein
MRERYDRTLALAVIVLIVSPFLLIVRGLHRRRGFSVTS